MRTISFVLLLSTIILMNCKKELGPTDSCSKENLLESYSTDEGFDVYIYENGDLYSERDGSCQFEFQYFDPEKLEGSYQITATDTFLVAGSDLFPIKNNYIEDFESAATFADLFVSSLNDTDLYWTSFTLQSPAAPTVEEYVALRKCILDGTCDFIDNRIDIASDPTNPSNTTLKFTSVAPSADMVTAKASISSQLNYYVQGSHFWFQADFYIESGMPFSLVDFESSYFDKSPGPRVVIRNSQLEVENKFSEKTNYNNTTNITVPTGEWFTVKVHLKYSSTNDGIIELWQNGEQLISATGVSLPLSNAIQDILEFGVSATPEGSVMYADNMRVSDTAF
ncbi:MAG: polysaccharide lyase [Cyclobacteriaceae bacterium]|nr:polysaccharide lyase [Cyclobacteriaceae bacterium]